MKGLPWRGLLYLVVLGYLYLDLKVFHGPLREAMRSRHDAALEAARENRWVALVNLEPLTQDQLDLAVVRHLHQRGRQAEEIPAKNLEMIRRAVLQSLIDDTLVRQYADGEKFEAPREETGAFVAAWRSRFGDPETLATKAAEEGLSPELLDAELARIWSRKRWLEKRILPAVEVTEEEARDWFEANRGEAKLREGFFEPEKVRLRHLLFASADEALAREWLVRLRTREVEFAAVATSSSLDVATKADGGELGWCVREDLPETLAEAVFSLAAGELSEPLQSERGWHLVLVEERAAERPLTYEELRPEIVAHLEAERTAETVKVLMEKLRTVANLQLFPENL